KCYGDLGDFAAVGSRPARHAAGCGKSIIADGKVLMTRADVTAQILEAKRGLGLMWQEIAEKLGAGSRVFYTAALLGHHALTSEEAQRAGAVLKLGEATALLTEIPEERGDSLKMPPSDPLIYRLYEIVQGYGPTLKALINEEFGDGIMSAID